MRGTTVVLLFGVLLGVISIPLHPPTGTKTMNTSLMLARRKNVPTAISALCDPSSSGPGNCLALWVICYLYYRAWRRRRPWTDHAYAEALQRRKRRSRVLMRRLVARCAQVVLQWNRFEELLKLHLRNNNMCSLIMEGPEGSKSILYVHRDARGVKIAESVTAATGIPINQHLLYCHDKLVHLNEAIEKQNIGDGDRIKVCLRLCGGSGYERCSICGVNVPKYTCEKCPGMSFCDKCNQFWHVSNPLRSGHSVINIDNDDSGIFGDCTPGTDNHQTMETNEVSDTEGENLDGTEDWDNINSEWDALDEQHNIDDMCKIATLAERFGLTSFRPYQKTIVDAAIAGKDTVVIQSTGSGKSLCYQFPAVYTGKLSVVITPTVSLMKDQTDQLNKAGIPAAFVGSCQPDHSIEPKALAPDSDIKVLFVTPEWLFSSNKLSLVKDLAEQGRIGLIAIDEAHLVYDWQVFREKYYQVESLKRELPTIPFMALSATIPHDTLRNLLSILHDPVISKGSVNRQNIKYFAEKLPSKGRPTGTTRGDFTVFAERVKDIVGDECSIVYTDFVVDIGPIMCELRNNGLTCAAYYGELDSATREASQSVWMSGDVQVMVATKAFGLGINKPNIRHVIRNGVPESLSAWVQEAGRAGRDGNPATAHILWEDSDQDHASVWIKNHIRNPPVRDNILRRFAESWKYIYAEIAGVCRRKVITDAFGEPVENATALDGACCDVCDTCIGASTDHRAEFEIAADAIQCLGPRGEVKLTEWIRGNKRAWMEDHDKARKSFGNAMGHSELWWRRFFRKCHAIGILERKLANMIKGSHQYAVLAVYQLTDKGCQLLRKTDPVMLSETNLHHNSLSAPLSASQSNTGTSSMSSTKTTSVRKERLGKGGRIIDRVSELLSDESRWVPISSREDYHYLGMFSDISYQYLLYCSDIDSLSSQTSPPLPDDFMWNDIQLSKGKVNGPRKVMFTVGKENKKVLMNYRMAPCGGVKICPVTNCKYTAAIREHHKCPVHGEKLQKQTECPVYFVYLQPVDTSDKRRWIAGMVIHQKEPTASLHTHLKPPPSKLLTRTLVDITNATERIPSLTAHEASQGTGIGHAIGCTDKVANNLGKVRYQIKKTQGSKVDPVTAVYEFERYADEIDQVDELASGELGGASLRETTGEKYRRLGRPYLRAAGVEDGVKYIVVMSPLMMRVLSVSSFVEADITYDENKEYPYMFNVTAFDEVTMKWMVVCRIRVTKQTAEAYSLCFRLLFEKCAKECPEFKVGETLVGIVVDWSDAQANGLKLAVGEDTGSKLLKGCQVHWVRSFQRIAEKVSKLANPEKRRIEVEAFKLVASSITKVTAKEHVLKLFQCLCGKTPLSEVHHLVPSLESHHVTVVDNFSNWSNAQHWVQWWTRLSHLRMLSPCFSEMDRDTWKMAPTTTNAVERKNLDAKLPHPIDLKTALIRVYKIDKATCLQYIAASENVRISYRDTTQQARKATNDRKRKQRAKKQIPQDKRAQHGPPDKSVHMELSSNSSRKGKRAMIARSKDENDPLPAKKASTRPTPPDLSMLFKPCQVLYDDNVWYSGQITGFEFNEDGCKWMFKISFPDGDTTLAASDDPEVKIV